MTASNTQVTTTVTLSSLGDNVTEATVTRWLKNAGDHLEEGEPLLEVATDKVDTEILSPSGGVLLEMLATEDDVIEVGGALAIIANSASDEVEPTTEAEPAPQALSVPEPDISDEYISTSTTEAHPDRVEKLPRIRQTIARRMLESLQTAAQLTTVIETDITAVARLRAQEKDAFHQRTGVKLSFLPFFVSAAVQALGEYRVVNSSLNAECTEVTYHGSVHLGMAVDSDKGLMVPVIRDAAGLGIAELARTIADSADKVRSGSIKPDDLTGGTFTITNTGSRGALFDTPIINQPQSAILGIGAVVERLLPTRDESGSLGIGVRSMAYLSLSYDHRIVDGADAARYLNDVRRRLETGFTKEDLQ